LDNILISTYKSPVGEIILGSFQDKLCLCDWKYRKQRKQIDMRIAKHFNTTFREDTSTVNQATQDQLNAYFKGEIETFNIPISFAGTTFQEKVWHALTEIPYGRTMSYLALSKSLGDQKAIRAVATANGANALSIIVPCHRIIGSDGSLVGYAGGLSAKKKLLKLEKSFPSEQLELF
jgi:methylated-DNA-[protein]-cysteine S-methyltransferase